MRSERTVIGLANLISIRVTEMGMDLSPKDVAFIVSLFFEGMVDISNPTPIDKWLIMMADELNNVKDE